MIAIDDQHLPGLANLEADTLQRITGRSDVSLLRLRYRAGKRAILHLDTNEGEGALWFFRGDKAKRLARRNKRTALYDEAAEALFEPFPNDHRMPQIKALLEAYDAVGADLIGAPPAAPPELLRYRPGLSCTFRCPRADGRAIYVKLINDDSPARLIEMNRQMTEALADSDVAIAPIIGAMPEFTAIAYDAAPGQPLDQSLVAASGTEPIRQAMDALRAFWTLRLAPERHLTAEALRLRGQDSVALTSVTVPEATGAVRTVLTRLNTREPKLRLCPIHADMKLEHVFLDGRHTTLIDTESVSMGPPDYDLAQLYGRLWQAELEGQIPFDLAKAAADEVRDGAGLGFDWCLDVVALRLAKFYAQRPGPDSAQKIKSILERLA